MAKDPAFLFYSSDFLTGTAFLTDEQVGKYIRILCFQHQKGRLKKEHMLQICKSYDEDIFCNFTIDDNGLYFNAKLEEEINRRKAYSESRRDNRKKKDIGNICKTYDKHMETETETETITKKETNNISPEHKKVFDIISFYNETFNKTYRLSQNEKMEMCHIDNTEEYLLEDWQVIFRNASKGWTIKGDNVKPSLKNILENHSRFLNDDYNLHNDKTGTEILDGIDWSKVNE